MPILLSTGFGLLIREFSKRLRPVNNRPVPALTRGLYTVPKENVVRRRRIIQNDPFDFEERRRRLGGNCVRRCHSSTKNRLNDEDWVPVYRFKFIWLYSLISRVKFFQTVFSTVILPHQTYQYFNSDITTNTYIAVLLFAALAPIILIGFTRFFNRIIGVVSFNEQKQLIRFGYLGFWGGRKNMIVDLDDVVPLTDTYDVESTKAIVRLSFHNQSYLLLSLRDCDIVDEELSREIFGSLKYFSKFKEQ